MILVVAALYMTTAAKHCYLTGPCEKLTTNRKSRIKTIMNNDNLAGNYNLIWSDVRHCIWHQIDSLMTFL